MVLLQCPLCTNEVELDDKAVGLFSCPHCSGEFEWGPSSDAFGDVLVAFLRSFVLTTLVFFCLSSGWLFLFEGVQLDEAIGLTFFLAIIAPVWIPVAFVPFFIHRARLFILHLRETG